MEFLNVGAGEILVIVLLALILFGPEDILKITRTIGKYFRTAQRMWTQVSQNLESDYLPEEVQEAAKEMKTTIQEAQQTLAGATGTLQETVRSVERDVGEAGASIQKTVRTVESDIAARAAALDADLGLDAALTTGAPAEPPAETEPSAEAPDAAATDDAQPSAAETTAANDGDHNGD